MRILLFRLFLFLEPGVPLGPLVDTGTQGDRGEGEYTLVSQGYTISMRSVTRSGPETVTCDRDCFKHFGVYIDNYLSIYSMYERFDEVFLFGLFTDCRLLFSL